MRRNNLLLSLALLAGFTACSLDIRRDAGNQFIMTLPAEAQMAPKPKKGVLTVVLPASDPGLDTRRIALTRPEGRLDYYAGARWSEFLPVLVQSSLVDALTQANAYSRVTRDDMAVTATARLAVTIESFQARYPVAGQAPEIDIRLSATLIDTVRHTSKPAIAIETHARASADSLPEIQAAFNKAYADATRQLIAALR